MSSADEDRSRAAYDAVADLYAEHFVATESELAVELAMIDHFVTVLPQNPCVLDAGCGAGRMMPFLASRGCRVRGIDLSPEMVGRAAADHPGFDVRVGSLTHIPFPPETFDGVLSWYSTIHNPDSDVPVMLSEMRRVLRPRGAVVVGFQTGDGPREVGHGYRRRGRDVTLTRYHRPLVTMTRALDDAGFAVVCSLEHRDPAEADGLAVVVAQAHG